MSKNRITLRSLYPRLEVDFGDTITGIFGSGFISPITGLSPRFIGLISSEQDIRYA